MPTDEERVAEWHDLNWLGVVSREAAPLVFRSLTAESDQCCFVAQGEFARDGVACVRSVLDPAEVAVAVKEVTRLSQAAAGAGAPVEQSA